ncbi:uncharacterized protein AB675_4406 [Cyphellophora attinorum]|uniref:Mid2 domain-containing protein n=1 Tax=Cyphellophora attinorum TaxID=1664694 RepID=A0A0N1HJD3_9EURO|nr:uncharacterized protein AB675_4406 [Phialophora attinorum]KPI36527.1 hypothetical protein AB675_4406 [Phialophora attinorum]
MKYFQYIAVTALSSLLVSTVVADPLDDAIALFRRQSVNLSTGVTSDTDTTPSTTPSATPTSSPSATPTSSPTDDVISTTTEISTSTRPQSTTASEESQTSAAESSSTPASTRVPTSVTSEIAVTFTTITNGVTSVGTKTSSTVIPTSTDVDSSSLASNNSSGGGGLSDTAKKTIGGVVGGVGGALLLAGLGYTAWRIWGKNRNLHDGDAYDPNQAQEKLSGSTDNTATPFSRTLDQYHQPGPVNQASNF